MGTDVTIPAKLNSGCFVILALLMETGEELLELEDLSPGTMPPLPSIPTSAGKFVETAWTFTGMNAMTRTTLLETAVMQIVKLSLDGPVSMEQGTGMTGVGIGITIQQS